MRNFARINNYYNKIAAIEDWEKLAKQAQDLGLSEAVERFRYGSTDGWRKIDKQAAKLRRVVESVTLNPAAQ